MKRLTWEADKTVATGCPDYQPDPYTGEYPSGMCAVYHCKIITESKVGYFETEEKAIDFASKAPLSCYDFKLDGKELEDKREREKIITLNVDPTATSGTISIGTNKITP